MKRKPVVILATVATAMLLGALARWPYVYYQLLRWIVCGIAAFLAYRSYRWGRRWALCLFGILAVLFNPLIPFHLSREVWRILDVMAAAGFCIGAMTLKGTRDLRNASRESFVTRSGEDVSYRIAEDDEGFTLELELKSWVPFAEDVEEALLVNGPARFKEWASEAAMKIADARGKPVNPIKRRRIRILRGLVYGALPTYYARVDATYCKESRK